MSLLPDSSFSSVLEVLAGKKWAFFQSPGNVGDRLITEGMWQLFARNNISAFRYEELIPDWADGLLLSGGGNFGKIWDHSIYRLPHLMQAWGRGLPVVILPQSICNPTELLPENVVVFAREMVSQGHFPGSILAPDLSLALDVDLDFGKPIYGRGVFLRKDHESVLGGSLGVDPITVTDDWKEYIILASEYSEVITDRLHFAIASMLAGRKTILMDNSYHKNKSMWVTWLRDLGCQFLGRAK